MAEKIHVMVKEPGEKWQRREVDNTLRTFQGLVGGHIETVTVTPDRLVLIVNEEGKLQELPENVLFRNDWLVGTVVAVGVAGEDFASCPLATDWQMRISLGVESARRR
jgi:hypothetical protein